VGVQAIGAAIGPCSSSTLRTRRRCAGLDERAAALALDRRPSSGEERAGRAGRTARDGSAKGAVTTRLQSIALYWDEQRLLEDLPLLQSRQDRAGVSVWSTIRADVTAAVIEFLGATDREAEARCATESPYVTIVEYAGETAGAGRAVFLPPATGSVGTADARVPEEDQDHGMRSIS
jgi:hypothetical protein